MPEETGGRDSVTVAKEPSAGPAAAAAANPAPPPAPTPSAPTPEERIGKILQTLMDADDNAAKALGQQLFVLERKVDASLQGLTGVNNNLLWLVSRLGNAGLIQLSTEEWEALGVKPKAAEIRAEAKVHLP